MSRIVIGAAGAFSGTVVAAADDLAFDSATEMWTVRTPDGREVTARTVIDTRSSPDSTVAAHGRPNYFRTPGPDVARQTRFVARCLDLLDRSGSTRMEAKSRIRLSRWRPRSVASSFYLNRSVPSDEDVYDGPVRVTVADREIAARGRLSGHLAAIDGHFHWRGIVSGDLPADLLSGTREVTVTIGPRRAQARVVERTPWGSYTVAGAGEPPFPLD
ncbi:DUF4873 domain-containing protein [Mycobacterium sp. NAZ190054]|uniref:DUF4873 domain-containing protein n=1 Tax=Mycobacterium sp. NAZ190054 TaxID=1747766 RepID=UPI000792ABE7|nr:DUF4873 domain-containing protein [Mycobacterium sp. NAZ190054]KWX57318.1 hypothetical protein ASJ79_11740 [Mycobacterium sp. NAZ190054]